jgi:hypothetical protein
VEGPPAWEGQIPLQAEDPSRPSLPEGSSRERSSSTSTKANSRKKTYPHSELHIDAGGYAGQTCMQKFSCSST